MLNIYVMFIQDVENHASPKLYFIALSNSYSFTTHFVFVLIALQSLYSNLPSHVRFKVSKFSFFVMYLKYFSCLSDYFQQFFVLNILVSFHDILNIHWYTHICIAWSLFFIRNETVQNSLPAIFSCF